MRQIALILCLVALALPVVSRAQTVPENQAQVYLSFAPVVQQAAPAVVNIYAQRIVADRLSPFANDPFFGDLFRNFGQVAPRVQNALGSGVVLSDDGIVV